MLMFFVFAANAQSKLDSLVKLSERMMMTDREGYYTLSDDIISLSKKEKNDSILIESYMTRAMVHALSRQYNLAINFYDSVQNNASTDSREYLEAQIGAVDLYPNLNLSDSLINNKHLAIIEHILPTKDSSLIASEYSNYGNYLVDNAAYYEGIQYLISAIDFTITSNTFSRVMNSVKLAKLFLYIEDVEKAAYYGNKANELAEQKNYKITGKLLALHRGRIALHQSNYTLADSLLKTALFNFKKAKAKNDVFSTYVYLANLELTQNKHTNCQIFLDSAALFKAFAKNDYPVGKYFLVKAKNQLKQKQFKSSENNLDSLEQVIQKTKNVFLKSGLLLAKARLAKDQKNFEESLFYYQEYHQLQDSLLEFKTTGKIYDLESKYQHKEKQKEIELLTTKNELISLKLDHARWEKRGILIVAIISLLFLAFLGITYFKVKAKNQLIKKTAAQKDILLKEIHHRVKNNLQLISSLLNLQARYIKDEKAKQVSMEGKTRVRAMSLIHQSLYQKDDLINLSIADYFQKLVRELLEIYHKSHEEVEVKFDIDHIDLDVDRVIPLGLIFNELMTNVLKYAFPEGRKGSVDVIMKKIENDLIMEVNDNGIGIDDQDITSNNNSFGFTLIEALLNKWKGKLNVKSKDGTQTQIVIPLIN